MKLGVAVGFFDFRNDVRRLLVELAAGHQVVVFCLARDRQLVAEKLSPGIELRIIDEHVRSLRNRLALRCYQLLKKLPKSRQNYYLMEHFKISLNRNPTARKKATLLLELETRLPELIDYDRYLAQLSYKGATPIDDIDAMVFFTDIIDDAFFARAIRENKTPSVYVYSWDHPCKHYRYSRKVDYLVWSNGIREDLQQLQGIDGDRIRVLGASQFAYIDQYRQWAKTAPARPYDFDYIYFGCAIGIPQLVADELAVITKIAMLLQQAGSPLKLVVRPYPVLNDWGYYDGLQALDNVLVDDAYRTMDLSVADADIMDKFHKVSAAKAFFHLGTTLGYEAGFTDTPVFILDYGYSDGGEAVSLRHFVHQYQNEKYFLLEGYPNVIRSDEALRSTLTALSGQGEQYLPYNLAMRADVVIQSFRQLADHLPGCLAHNGEEYGSSGGHHGARRLQVDREQEHHSVSG